MLEKSALTMEEVVNGKDSAGNRSYWW